MMNDQDFVLRLENVLASPLPGDVYEVMLQTSRGDISCIFHPSRGELGGVIWAGGSGPGDLYLLLSEEFRRHGISSLRVRYRDDGNFAECALDVLGAISFLKAFGVATLALVGASFSGAVAICAGALSEVVSGVVALCPQRYGTHLVDQLPPRHLLLVHGTADEVIPYAASEEIYRRAKDPKELVLYPGAGHGLLEARDELEELLRGWLIERVGRPAPRGVGKALSAPEPRRRLVPSAGGVRRAIEVIEGDLAAQDSEALVCPANDELIMQGAVASALANAAGPEVQVEVVGMGPVRVGDVVVTGAGRLSNKYVFHAVTASTAFGFRPTTEEAVALALKNALSKADELGLHSLAIPALGGGGGGLHLEQVARIMLGVVSEHLRGETSLEQVTLVLRGESAWRVFEGQLNALPLEGDVTEA